MAQRIDNAHAPGRRDANHLHGPRLTRRRGRDADGTGPCDATDCGDLPPIMAPPTTLEPVRTTAAAGDAEAVAQLALLAQSADGQAARGNGG